MSDTDAGKILSAAEQLNIELAAAQKELTFEKNRLAALYDGERLLRARDQRELAQAREAICFADIMATHPILRLKDSKWSESPAVRAALAATKEAPRDRVQEWVDGINTDDFRDGDEP